MANLSLHFWEQYFWNEQCMNDLWEKNVASILWMLCFPCCLGEDNAVVPGCISEEVRNVILPSRGQKWRLSNNGQVEQTNKRTDRDYSQVQSFSRNSPSTEPCLYLYRSSCNDHTVPVHHRGHADNSWNVSAATHTPRGICSWDAMGRRQPWWLICDVYLRSRYIVDPLVRGSIAERWWCRGAKQWWLRWIGVA